MTPTPANPDAGSDLGPAAGIVDGTNGSPGNPGAGGGSSGGGAGASNGPGGAGPRAVEVTWGPLTSAMSALGISIPFIGGMTVAPTLVTTTGAVTMAMAFGLFGRRRSDGEPPATNAQLAAAAAAGVATVALALRSEGGVEAAEAMLPRWRRPSLIEARKANSMREAAPTARLSFDQGLVGPLDGHERRLIRYRVVRMLDTPDELRGTEIGYLDRGDEVQLLEKYAAFWLVLCPDGRQGWIHNMTLGDVVDAQALPDRPVATMPTNADSWTMGDSDADSDVLDAYLESRRRDP